MRKLMWFTMGYALACAVGTWLIRGSGVLIAGAVCLAAALLLWHFREQPAVKRGMALALGCAMGCGAFFCYEWFVLRPAAIMDGEQTEVRIRATGYGWETEYGTACDGELELYGKTYRVRFYLNEQRDLSPGDVVQMRAKLRQTDEGGEREPTFHRTSGILLLAYQRGTELTVEDRASQRRDQPALWRQKLLGIIDRCFPEDVAAFAKALLLGDKSDLTWEQSRDFSISGISHIVAVSGLHISILFALVTVLVGKRRYLMAAIGIPVLFFFGAMAGFTLSVTRAVLMQTILILAQLLNREYDPPTALAAAVLVMLVQCPLTISGIGFQLSVASVAGIFLWFQPIRAWLQIWLPGKGKKLRGRLERWLRTSAAVTLSATVMTVPLTAIHFDTVSLVGVLTNLIVLPVVSGIFYGIMAVCVLGCFHTGAAAILAGVIAWPIRYVLAAAKALASLPLAAVYTVSPYIVIWLALVYGLLGWLLMCRKKRVGLTACCAVLGLCVSLMLSCLEPLCCDYRVTVLDVGQGQCIVLQSAGSTFLVDCGGDRGEEAADRAAEYLLSQGIGRIDGLILTHYDRDHAEGVQFLARRVEIGQLFLSTTEDTDGCLESVLASCEHRTMIDTELVISFGDAVIRLFPAKDAGSGNDSCASVLFQRGKCDTLITGDLSAAAERQLLRDYDIPDLEVLIVGHHGSKYSTCTEVLEATAPDVAMISVGAENSYGHPTAEVLERLKQAGCMIYRTDLHGTITYRG